KQFALQYSGSFSWPDCLFFKEKKGRKLQFSLVLFNGKRSSFAVTDLPHEHQSRVCVLHFTGGLDLTGIENQ
ncbi:MULTISPECIES: hypothetical protein, partial [unclassified Brenneria]|uniref:hypothetical protein n=1 Tax=unclassified Brenneria TaxID=2634434 RepID=UPI001C130EE3